MKESKLRSLRKNKNLTQEDVARILFMTRQGYSRIERGMTRLSLADATKLAELFDVPLAEIAEGLL